MVKGTGTPLLRAMTRAQSELTELAPTIAETASPGCCMALASRRVRGAELGTGAWGALAAPGGEAGAAALE
eukprot:CAMPEP_0171232976 /NCGR_PEP_ID=MMETSP0790-20130122/40684_1 /TAXON_ID=2925 /ORGANISM="Alexandrium catenella, Strain OF101" /LENGTH=70 /DNA_ID=CAMNT_0011699225 /DNA_START=63 /DNA_END=273 /DNA_ORIENTATION=-